jgi:minimal PKS chain-length factor (CLF/KS beta)
MTRRAVITGLGVLAPSGSTPAEHWATVQLGASKLGTISAFDASKYPTQVAGEIRDLDMASLIEGRLVVQTDRWTWMALLGTDYAIEDAGLDLSQLDPFDLSVVLASSSGGNAFGQRELQRLWSDPARTVGAYQSIAWFYAASVGQVSIRNQAKGPSNVVLSESAGGLDSLAHAARLIKRGVPVVLAGGLEAPLSPYALACQLRSGRLNPVTEPEHAYQPFDVAAAGYVPGEGGVVFVVEELEAALARNAPTIYGEILGSAATHDGALTGRAPANNHRYYAAALRLALERAGRLPAEVDLLIPDAVGLRSADRDEAAAINEVFAGRAVPVSTQKPLVGRMYQGGSALDAATALLALHHQTMPASVAPRNPAPGCELNFTVRSSQERLDTTLIGARGFDGYNSALVLGRYQPDRPSTEPVAA